MIVTIKSAIEQSDGRVSVSVEYDSGHDIVTKNYLLDSDIDVNKYANSKIDAVFNQLKTSEINHLSSTFSDGVTSVQDMIDSFKYININDALNVVIERGSTLISVYRLVNMKGIYLYTKNNFTNEQLSQLSGHDLNIVELYYSRIETALTCEESLNTLNGNTYNG